jgi:hypothetical protein
MEEEYDDDEEEHEVIDNISCITVTTTRLRETCGKVRSSIMPRTRFPSSPRFGPFLYSVVGCPWVVSAYLAGKQNPPNMALQWTINM